MRSISRSKENYSKYKFEKFIKQLKELDIHPILIPKDESITKLINPLKQMLL